MRWRKASSCCTTCRIRRWCGRTPSCSSPLAGTAFPQVARAAAAAGIGWVVLNHDVDYVHELRRTYKVPVFAISSDHQQVGKIQGQQLAALLPNGGTVLYIEGPANSSAAKDRTTGMMRNKPANIQIKSMRANWTEESAYRTVSSWLRLRTSLESHIDVVDAQDDSMAMGARKAFQELGEGDRATLDADSDHRVRWYAEDGTGMGQERHAGGDDLHPSRIPTWPLRCWSRHFKNGSDAAGEPSHYARIRAISGGTGSCWKESNARCRRIAAHTNDVGTARKAVQAVRGSASVSKHKRLRECARLGSRAHSSTVRAADS